jgi:hypothetical protein
VGASFLLSLRSKPLGSLLILKFISALVASGLGAQVGLASYIALQQKAHQLEPMRLSFFCSFF